MRFQNRGAVIWVRCGTASYCRGTCTIAAQATTLEVIERSCLFGIWGYTWQWRATHIAPNVARVCENVHMETFALYAPPHNQTFTLDL